MKTVHRVGLVLLAGALLGLAVVQAVTHARAGRELEELLARTGLERRQPAVAESARREPDPVRARLLLARALVVEAVDQSSFAALEPREAVEEVSRVGERLLVAEGIAAGVLEARPALWQGCFLLGAARYLAWSRSGDTRLATDREAWEEPLREAVRRAPLEEEPLQFLALTRLELWPALTAAEQAAAGVDLVRAFATAGAFARLAGLWLEVAGSFEAAADLVPAHADAWREVARVMASRGDPEGWIAARRREREVLLTELGSQIAEAAERLSGGDADGARRLLVDVVATAPRDRVGAALVGQAMRLVPAGVASAAAWTAFAPWVRWAGTRLVLGLDGLPPAVVARMMAAAEDVPEPGIALAWLAAGDLGRAERLERRAEDRALEKWAPYFVAKARVLGRRGDFSGARLALARVHRNWAGHPAMERARLEVASGAGDAAAVAESRGRLLAATGTSWPGTSWRWSGGEATLELEVGRACAGLSIATDVAPQDGAVAAIQLDNEPAELLVARAGTPMVLRSPLAAGHHALAVTTALGGRVVPGEVSLLP